MKASELRIGNLVKINNDMMIETKGEVYKVSGFNARFDMAFPDSKGTVSLDHTKSIRTYSQFDEFIEPIPLAEELLLKFGFIDKELKLTQNTSLYVCIRTENKFHNEGKALIMQMGNAMFSMPCEYLHELQNIWKVLTGNELTIKN
jgi:hypothetical protein